MIPPPVVIRNVAIVGGTHGNEYTGVWCIKALERQLQQQQQQVMQVAEGKKNIIRIHNNNKSSGSSYSSSSSYPFGIQTLIGNPQAFLQNKRFMDTDLNRQFSFEALQQSKQTPIEQRNVEQTRALQLNELLGPKQFGKNDDSSSQIPQKMDVIVDLHTTTTNMGTTLIVGQGDVLSTQCAAYVLAKCPFPIRILMHTHSNQNERPHLSSIASHSFTIEVGPVPQGVIRHDKVQEMQTAIDLFLQALQMYIQYPDGIQQTLQNAFPTGHVPCWRSAPALRNGEMSAKLSWPSDCDNPNFPSYLVHQNIQDQDFTSIQTGDPLFVDLDGNVIRYDGSHGSPVTLMFINEGGYYYGSSGTGISVAQEDVYDWNTGTLLSSSTSSTTTTKSNKDKDITVTSPNDETKKDVDTTTTTTTSVVNSSSEL